MNRLGLRRPAPPASGPARPPDLVGIGAQKAGTSWWWELIVAHPGFTPSVEGVKELHHFDGFASTPFDDAAVAAYHAHFRISPDRRTGEWTPRYLSDPWVAAQLRRAAPDARLVAMLRDPVERYRSGLSHLLQRGVAIDDAARSDAFARGLYGTHLARWLREWPRDQILVLQYEQCRADPAPHLQRTHHHAGLDPTPRPRRIRRRVNVTTAQATLSAQERDELALAYRDDLRLLLDLTDDIDPSLWPACRTLTG